MVFTLTPLSYTSTADFVQILTFVKRNVPLQMLRLMFVLFKFMKYLFAFGNISLEFDVMFAHILYI